MADYSEEVATAKELIAESGFVATIKGNPTPADPVTGAGGSAGGERTVGAVKLRADRRAFPDTLIEQATCMLLCDGPVATGENWLDGGVARPVINVQPLAPDNATHIITKALIG